MEEKIYKTENKDWEQFTTPDIMAQINKLETVPEFMGYIHTFYTGRKAICTHTGRIFTYARLFADMLKGNTMIHNLGVKPGQNVALYFENSYRFIVCAMAVMTFGAVAVPIPSTCKYEQINDILKKYDCVALITDETWQQETVKVTIPKIDAAKFLDINFNAGPIQGFNTRIKPTDPAVILLTGGTSGTPKGVVLSHTSLMRGVMNGVLGLPNPYSEIYYAILPFTHSFGFIRSMMCSLYTGSLLYINKDKGMIFKELIGFKPTILCVVPAIAELFLTLIKLHGPNFLGGNLKTIICGGANVPTYLVEEYNKLGINFCPGYGLTEFANLVSGNPRSAKYPSSVGMIFPEQEAKIVDGELWLKGRNMGLCYYNDEVKTKEVMTPDGWFKTGDLARFDEDNNLYIIGRKDETIVLSNGEKVIPGEIESKIHTLNLIQDCLVYAETSEAGGSDYIKAEVILRPVLLKDSGMDAAQAQDVVQRHIDKINESLPEHSKIAKLVIREKDFDRSPNMKILRPKR